MTKSEALETSILHWQENAKAETLGEVQVGADACDLCDLYYDNVDCEGCPVADAGMPGCVGSPYMAALDALYSLASREEFRRCAQAEVDFLISLRETVE